MLLNGTVFCWMYFRMWKCIPSKRQRDLIHARWEDEDQVTNNSSPNEQVSTLSARNIWVDWNIFPGPPCWLAFVSPVTLFASTSTPSLPEKQEHVSSCSCLPPSIGAVFLPLPCCPIHSLGTWSITLIVFVAISLRIWVKKHQRIDAVHCWVKRTHSLLHGIIITHHFHCSTGWSCRFST